MHHKDPQHHSVDGRRGRRGQNPGAGASLHDCICFSELELLGTPTMAEGPGQQRDTADHCVIWA